MSRLIDADALWMAIIHRMDYCDDILEIIEGMPTIEPERKTGKWIYDDEAYPGGNPYGHYECSVCGESVPHKTNYCQNCGAKMGDNE